MDNNFHIKTESLIKIRGKNSYDYLNRVSTNLIAESDSDNVQKTLFLNEKGRLISFASVFKYEDDVFILDCSGNIENLFEFLLKYSISEDLEISVFKNNFYLISVFSKNNDYIIESIRNNSSQFFENYNNKFLYLFKEDYGYNCAKVLISQNLIDKIKEHLNGLNELRDDEFEYIRIKNKILCSSNEINSDYNPLDCNLDEFISFNKGCYIGQEVIARLSSQNKVQKVLIGIESNNFIDKNDVIFTKNSNGNFIECGKVTSAIFSNSLYFGLGFIQRKFYNKGYTFCINKNQINIF